MRSDSSHLHVLQVRFDLSCRGLGSFFDPSISKNANCCAVAPHLKLSGNLHVLIQTNLVKQEVYISSYCMAFSLCPVQGSLNTSSPARTKIARYTKAPASHAPSCNSSVSSFCQPSRSQNVENKLSIILRGTIASKEGLAKWIV